MIQENGIYTTYQPNKHRRSLVECMARACFAKIAVPFALKQLLNFCFFLKIKFL